MADNPNVRGDGDRLRINVNQDHEVRCWSQKFDVSPEELRQAVRDIGTMASAVKDRLRHSRGKGE